VTSNDGRLRAERRFQIIRMSDKKTVLRARSDYICTNLTNGRPARMPDIFKVCFAVPPRIDCFLAQAQGDDKAST